MDSGNSFADKAESGEDSAFEICSRYSSILSKFDVPGSFSEEAWLYKPEDKDARSQESGLSDLHSQLARYLNEPDVENLKRSLLLHLGAKSKKETNTTTPQQSEHNKWSAKFKRKAAGSALPVPLRRAAAPLNHEMDWLEWDDSDVYLLEEEDAAPVRTQMTSCRQNGIEQNHLQDITDIEIAAKMQEEYLQRSVLQLAKRLAADECQCESVNGQGYQNAPAITTASQKLSAKCNRINRPGRTYGIRSNTQTLRVSPISVNAQSSPFRPPVKYSGRSTTQTLRVSPIAPHSGRTLSVPRSAGKEQKVRSQSRGTPVFSQRLIPPSPTKVESKETISHVNAAANQSNRTSRINSIQAYARSTKLNKDMSQRSVSSGPNRPQNFSEGKSRLQSSSRVNTARNVLSKLSALKIHQQPTSSVEKPRSQGPNIVRCIAGGGTTQNGTSRQPKPSFLPRPRATDLLKRKFNLGQFNNT